MAVSQPTTNPMVFDAATQGQGTGSDLLLRGDFTRASATVLTMVNHGYKTGNGPIQFVGGDLPDGLSTSTNYWIIRVTADTFSVATTQALAEAGTVHTVGDAGSGTLRVWSLPVWNNKIYVQRIIIVTDASGGDYEVRDRLTTGSTLTGLVAAAANTESVIEINTQVYGLYVSAFGSDGKILVYHGRP